MQSILFVRCVPLEPALAALRALRGRYPEATVAVVTAPGAVAILKDAGLDLEFVIHDRPRFGWFSMPLSTLRQLRTRRFDAAVVPFVAYRSRYRNVASLAKLFRAGRAVWLNVASPDADLLACPLVSSREESLGARVRGGAVRFLKWPLLTLAYGAGMVALAVTILVLVPLVWLKPEPRDAR